MSNIEIKPEPPEARPAGWYADEAKFGIERWWSGESWSEYTRPTPQSAPPGVEQGAAASTSHPETAVPLIEATPARRRGFMGLVSAAKASWLRLKLPARILSALAVAAALVLLLGVLLPSLLQPKHHLQAVINLTGDASGMLSGSPDVEGSWNSCSGTGGYSDFTTGAAATIRDGEGNIVGQLEVRNFDSTTLDSMLTADEAYEFAGWGDDPEEAKSVIELGADLGISCLLYVEGDVKDSDFYSFTFARRGELSYSREQLADDGWWISLSLGS